jgi:myosin heavy subunit
MAAPPARPEKGAAKPWLKGQTDDLASLANLDDVVLLEELKTRYSAEKIYV